MDANSQIGFALNHIANFNASGADLIMGSAKFIGPRTLAVSFRFFFPV